jgi:hypothetical protein
MTILWEFEENTLNRLELYWGSLHAGGTPVRRRAGNTCRKVRS